MVNDKSIIICSIVRNAEKGLKNNIPIIDKFLSLFKKYKIIIYENDSVDNTKVILEKWSNYHNSDKFHLISENRDARNTIPSKKEVKIVNPYFSKKRISKMVELRNRYLDYIYENNWSADFLMIVDLDVARLNLDGIVNVLNSHKQWDAVCANGYSLSPTFRFRYHDTYALTEWGDENNPQTEEKILKLSSKYGQLKINDAWIRIYSGFGGLSIYNFDAIKGIRYKLIENNDERVEVKCEHYSIYHQMIQKGYNRFFIVPALRLKYQSIDIKFLFRKVQEFFN